MLKEGHNAEANKEDVREESTMTCVFGCAARTSVRVDEDPESQKLLTHPNVSWPLY